MSHIAMQEHMELVQEFTEKKAKELTKSRMPCKFCNNKTKSIMFAMPMDLCFCDDCAKRSQESILHGFVCSDCIDEIGAAECLSRIVKEHTLN